MSSASSASSSEDEDAGKGLNAKELAELKDMLKHLSLRRQDIKEAMGFALDHAESASDVVAAISHSLQKDVTPAPIKVCAVGGRRLLW